MFRICVCEILVVTHMCTSQPTMIPWKCIDIYIVSISFNQISYHLHIQMHSYRISYSFNSKYFPVHNHIQIIIISFSSSEFHIISSIHLLCSIILKFLFHSIKFGVCQHRNHHQSLLPGWYIGDLVVNFYVCKFVYKIIRNVELSSYLTNSRTSPQIASNISMSHMVATSQVFTLKVNIRAELALQGLLGHDSRKSKRKNIAFMAAILCVGNSVWFEFSFKRKSNHSRRGCIMQQYSNCKWDNIEFVMYHKLFVKIE